MDDPDPIEPVLPKGAWKEFCYDRESVGLPLKQLAELGEKRQGELVSGVLHVSAIGTGFTLAFALSWWVGLLAMASVLVLTGVIAGVFRAQRNDRLVAWEKVIKQKLVQGELAAPLSRRFIGLLSFLALVISASLTWLGVSQAIPSELRPDSTLLTVLGDEPSMPSSRFTTPSGRCSADLPGEPTYREVGFGSGRWSVTDVDALTVYTILEVNTADVPGSAGLSPERFLEVAAQAEVNNVRSQSESFVLHRSELVEDVDLPTFDLRYTVQLPGDPRVQNLKHTIYGPDGYTCSVVLAQPEAPSGDLAESFLSSLQVSQATSTF